MKVLVACEFSGVVREAFRKRGHDAWSCDLLPALDEANWMHTKQASPYLKFCSKIVSVGRVKWIPDSKTTGKDNCAWYLFKDNEQETLFYGR